MWFSEYLSSEKNLTTYQIWFKSSTICSSTMAHQSIYCWPTFQHFYISKSNVHFIIATYSSLERAYKIQIILLVIKRIFCPSSLSSPAKSSVRVGTPLLQSDAVCLKWLAITILSKRLILKQVQTVWCEIFQCLLLKLNLLENNLSHHDAFFILSLIFTLYRNKHNDILTRIPTPGVLAFHTEEYCTTE